MMTLAAALDLGQERRQARFRLMNVDYRHVSPS